MSEVSQEKVKELDKKFARINGIGALLYLVGFITLAAEQRKFSNLWTPVASVAVFTDTTYAMYDKFLVYPSPPINRGWMLAASYLVMFMGTLTTTLHCLAHRSTSNNFFVRFYRNSLNYTELSIYGCRPWLYFYSTLPLVLMTLTFFCSFGMSNSSDLVLVSALVAIGVLLLIPLNDLLFFSYSSNEEKLREYWRSEDILVFCVLAVMTFLVFVATFGPLIPVFINIPNISMAIDGKLWTAFSFYILWIILLPAPLTIRRMVGFDTKSAIFKYSHGSMVEMAFVFVPLIVMSIFSATIFTSDVSVNYFQAFYNWVNA